MGVVIAIPARYQSTRYPGKPLVELKGCSGISRSLVQRTWLAAAAVPGVDDVIVATDDGRIADHASSFGARVMMTSDSCRNGTERCAEVLDQLGTAPDLLVNVQGDAPLTPPSFVKAVIDGIGEADCATPVLRCDAATFSNFLDDRRNGRVGATTAIFDRRGRALYFSKEIVPFADAVEAARTPEAVFHHVGLYAYRPAALRAYAAWPQGRLEALEGLEQLRFLENGAAIQCVEVDAGARLFWELNNPVDVARIEAAFATLGID
jgi:3-deoxy-manno-octulosonate cytidylyltransferase (CMP-KDO synthetase)